MTETTVSTSPAFDCCGDFATVRRVVSAFYERIRDLPALRRRFEVIDVRAMVDHQTEFLTSMMGGPAVNWSAAWSCICEPMQIALCEETVKLIGDGFIVAEIGEVDVKGFGRQRLFALEDERRT